MAAAPITMSATRKAVVDFADTFQDVSITALVHVDADFTSIDDVIAAKNWTLGRIKGSSTEAAIKSNMQYSGLWSAIASSKNSAVSTTEEGITRVLNSKFAFFMERPLAEYAIAQNCELKMVGQLDSQGGGYAFPLKKNNPKAMKLLSDINRGLQLIRDDGTLRHLEDEWWEHQTCSGTSLIASLTLSIVGALCTRLML